MTNDRVGTAATYFALVTEQLAEVLASQRQQLGEFSKLWAHAIAADKLLYVFGSGHSRFIAGELYWRAGGLAPVIVIDDPADGVAERVEGYASTFLEAYAIRPGDLLLVISNSGINPAPIETAMYGKAKGATLIALTSLAHSEGSSPRHSSGTKLFELADLVIDSGVPAGDALVELGSGQMRAGPASTVVGAAVLNAVVAQTAQNLLDMGVEPPLLVSANLEAGDRHNRELVDRYWERLTKYPRRGLL